MKSVVLLLLQVVLYVQIERNESERKIKKKLFCPQ